jgi:hypothetical protein
VTGSDNLEAALAFYKALKVYPQPKDLISIYDKTVPKECLEILTLASTWVAHSLVRDPLPVPTTTVLSKFITRAWVTSLVISIPPILGGLGYLNASTLTSSWIAFP